MERMARIPRFLGSALGTATCGLLAATTAVPMRTLVTLVLLMVAACGGPTQPTRPEPSAEPIGQAFEVAGVVTDERGMPMPGTTVTLSHWLGRSVLWPSTLTDAAGSYRISSTATLLGNGYVARVQVVADGYEEYWRSIRREPSSASWTFVENVRLDRITRLTAGESIVFSVPPDVGECRGWVAPVCPLVRVALPAQGRLSIEVQPLGHNSIAFNPPGHSGELPPVEICCVNGNEEYGNPITVPVAPGPDLEVKVGVRREFATTLTFLVKTSFEPLD